MPLLESKNVKIIIYSDEWWFKNFFIVGKEINNNFNYLFGKLDKNINKKILIIYNYLKAINDLSLDLKSDINESYKPQD